MVTSGFTLVGDWAAINVLIKIKYSITVPPIEQNSEAEVAQNLSWIKKIQMKSLI